MLSAKFTPDTTFPEGDVRRGWVDQDWYRGQLVMTARFKGLANGDRTPAQVALAFVLLNLAVDTTIPGAKDPNQVEQNAPAAGVDLSDDDAAGMDDVASAPH